MISRSCDLLSMMGFPAGLVGHPSSLDGSLELTYGYMASNGLV